MLGTILIEVLVILILVGINGLLAMSELSIISSRKGRLRSLAQSGDKKAALALELSEAPDRMLSTVQIGITLMGILSGVFGGAALAEMLAAALITLGLSESAAEPISFAIVVLFITYLSLVLGELVPKRIALNDPEAAARRLAGPIRVLAKITSPFVSILSASTRVILKVIGMNEPRVSSVSEEEVQVLIDEGTQSGVFEEEERSMVSSIFKMSDLSVKDLMTPRTEIDWLDINDPVEKNLECVRSSSHSYFPLGEGTIDENVGIVRAKDFLFKMVTGDAVDIRSLASEAVMIPETASAFEALEQLKGASSPMAIVIDEYGGIDGLITQSDLLSAIVGGMAAMQETPTVIERNDGSYLIDGMLPIEEFRALLGTVNSRSEEVEGYRTLAGLLLSKFGRIPKASESIVWNGYRIEVIDLDGRRIDKVLITRL